MKKIPPVFIVALLIFSGFLFFNFTFAINGDGTNGTAGDGTTNGTGEEEEEEPPCEPCPCGGYYYCSGDCDGQLRYVTPGEPCCGGGACEDIWLKTAVLGKCVMPER